MPQIIAIMIDKTYDWSKKSQLTTIFGMQIRVVCWMKDFQNGFSDVSSNYSTRALSKYVIEVEERSGCSSQIVCQMYNRSSVMYGTQ